jgi:hypothetical protein
VPDEAFMHRRAHTGAHGSEDAPHGRVRKMHWHSDHGIGLGVAAFSLELASTFAAARSPCAWSSHKQRTNRATSGGVICTRLRRSRPSNNRIAYRSGSRFVLVPRLVAELAAATSGIPLDPGERV